MTSVPLLAGLALFGAGASAIGGPEPTPTPAPAPQGIWGGIGIRVEIGETATKIELDAAHGRIDGPLALDDGGRFEAAGTLVRERPGPARAGDEDAGAEPARYRGTIAGETLTLEVALPRTGTSLGPLQARRGAPARLRKML